MKKSASEIDKEINELSERMAKAADLKQTLLDTILNLGPEGLKKAAENLTSDQQELLKACMEDLKKTANMPEVTEDSKEITAKRTKTPAAKMKTESLSGSDDEDEKLMKEKNDEIKHQGGPKDSPLEGQIIKSKETPHKGPGGGIIIGHTRNNKPIYEKANHEGHKEFSPKDHKDAHDKHMEISSPIRMQMEGPMDPKDERSKEEKDKAHMELYHHARAHENEAREHLHMSAKKEDKEMEKCYGPSMSKGYEGFKAVEESAKEGGAKDPAAVAAAVGMKKYGKGKMEEMAHEGKKAPEMEKAYENSMTKSEKLAKKQGVPEGVDPEKHEDCVHDVKAEGHGKVSAIKICNASMQKGEEMENEKHEQEEDKAIAKLQEIQSDEKKGKKEKEPMSPEEKLAKKEMKKAKKIKKSLKKIVKMAKSLKMSKDQVVKAIKEANNNLKLVKAEMKAKLLKEEDQVKMAGQDKGALTQKVDTSDGELCVEPDETADEALAKLPKVEKSVQWNLKSSIAANSLGRNTHWNVDEYIVKAEEEKQDTIKKGAYFGEAASEELKKSTPEKMDLNDLIEKGFDYSREEIERLEGIKNHKNDGSVLVKKSFSDREIAAALGMDEKTYKELMGE